MYGYAPYSTAPYSSQAGGVVENISVEISGVVAFGNLGNEVADIAIPLTGVEALGFVGDITGARDEDEELHGVTAAGFLGTLGTLSEDNVQVSGNFLNAFVGTLTPFVGEISVLTGVAAADVSPSDCA